MLDRWSTARICPPRPSARPELIAHLRGEMTLDEARAAAIIAIAAICQAAAHLVSGPDAGLAGYPGFIHRLIHRKLQPAADLPIVLRRFPGKSCTKSTSETQMADQTRRTIPSADQRLMLTPIAPNPQAGRWRTEAMRSHATPRLLFIAKGQGRITIAGLTPATDPTT